MNRSNLRQALLEVEATSPELERRYRERVTALFERRLTGVQRGGIVAGMLVAAWGVIRVVQLFVQAGNGASLVAVVGLAVAFVFSVGFIAFSAWQLRGGVEDVRRHAFARTRLVGLFTFALALVMLWAGVEALDPAKGIRLILFGLVFWTTIGLPFYLTHLVHMSELRLRVELLGIELAMARAAERTEPRP